MIAAHIVPDEMTLLAAAEAARRQGMRIYSNGQRAVISPCKPTAGRWEEIRVTVFIRDEARLEALSCPA